LKIEMKAWENNELIKNKLLISKKDKPQQ